MLTLDGVAPGFFVRTQYGRLLPPPPPPAFEEMPALPDLTPPPPIQMPMTPPAFPTRAELPAPGLPPAIVPYPGVRQTPTGVRQPRTDWRTDPDWILEASVKAQQFQAHRAQMAAEMSRIAYEILDAAKKTTGLSSPGTISPYRLIRLKNEIENKSVAAMRIAKPSEINVWVGDTFNVDLSNIHDLDKACGIWKRGKSASYWIIRHAEELATKLVLVQFPAGPYSATIYRATQSGRIDALQAMNMNPKRNPGYKLDWPTYDKLVALTVQHSKAIFSKGAQYDKVGYLIGPTALTSQHPESEWIKQAKRLLSLRAYKEPTTPRQTAPSVWPEGQYTPPPGSPALPTQAGPINLAQAIDQGVLTSLSSRGLPDMNMTTKYERRYHWPGGARYYLKTQVPGSPMTVSAYAPIEDHAVALAKVAYMQSGGFVEGISERDWQDAARRNLAARHYKPI